MKFLNRKTFLLLILFISLGGFIISTYLKINQPLNLIIISSDTLRADHMGIYGYQKNTTPNIDKWAQGATVFTNAKTMIPFTLPSFVSLMTGKTPFQTRIYTNLKFPIPNDADTLADVLKRNGYKTAAFVTNYVLGKKITTFYERFDIFKSVDYYYGNEDRYKLEGLVKEAKQYIQANKNKKIFVWIHILDPHAPYNPVPELKCKFNDKYCDYISTKTDYELGVERIKIRGCKKEEDVPVEKRELLETLYDGEIFYMDSLFKGVIETIKASNLDNKSVVLFYGDHGEGMDHDYFFAHEQVLYNSLVRLPVIIKAPFSLTKGKKVDQLITNTDIFPTLLDLLRIPVNKDRIDGVSFSNVFDSSPLLQSKSNRNTVYSANNYLSKFALEENGYKYIYSLDNACLYKDQREELYDQKADFNETKNLINEKKNIAENMKKKLLDFIKNNIAAIKLNAPQQVNEEVLEKLKSIGY